MSKKPPKTATVKKNVSLYAGKCNMTVNRQYDGTYTLFDNVMRYDICRGSHDDVVRSVVDALWDIYYLSNNQPS